MAKETAPNSASISAGISSEWRRRCVRLRGPTVPAAPGERGGIGGLPAPNSPASAASASGDKTVGWRGPTPAPARRVRAQAGGEGSGRHTGVAGCARALACICARGRCHWPQHQRPQQRTDWHAAVVLPCVVGLVGAVHAGVEAALHAVEQAAGAAAVGREGHHAGRPVHRVAHAQHAAARRLALARHGERRLHGAAPRGGGEVGGARAKRSAAAGLGLLRVVAGGVRGRRGPARAARVGGRGAACRRVHRAGPAVDVRGDGVPREALVECDERGRWRGHVDHGALPVVRGRGALEVGDPNRCLRAEQLPPQGPRRQGLLLTARRPDLRAYAKRCRRASVAASPAT